MKLPAAADLSLPMPPRLERYAECALPTKAGNFRLIVAGDPSGEATLATVEVNPGHGRGQPTARFPGRFAHL